MKKYFAFISYKRSGVDEEIANWIHLKLEKYPYPNQLVKSENKPNDTKFIRPVFLDTKELSVKPTSFINDLKLAIENSQYLLLICSKDSVCSEFVNLEVEYFLHTHNNDVSKILPIFVDNVNCGLPNSLKDLNLLNRNCPIYNTNLDSKTEINLYCFYHIVSFLLKVDFELIYNRYTQYKQKKEKQKKFIRRLFNSFMVCIIVILSLFIYTQFKLIDSQKHIVKLEKEIFPYSVVTGYVGNFLKPVVEYIKVNEPNSHIYVHMPTKSKDIDNNHKDRFNVISKKMESLLSIDSIRFVRLNTSMPRGSLVHKMYSCENINLNSKYLDFASTTSTFLSIAKKKKENPAYKDENIDDMIKEYSDIFIRQAKELLQSDSIYVTFTNNLSDIVDTPIDKTN